MVSGNYPLVIWSPDANGFSWSGAAANGEHAGSAGGAQHVETAHWCDENDTVVQLRADVAFWKCECIGWKARARWWEMMFHKAKAKAAEREAKLGEKITALQAEVRNYEQQLRGGKSEKNKKSEKTYPGSPEHKPSGRHRGQQPGKGKPPRRDYSHLPTSEEIISLPAEQCRCEKCGQPFVDFPGSDDGEIIEVDVRAHRRKYRRRRYRRT
jgi:hypothetical protein